MLAFGDSGEDSRRRAHLALAELAHARGDAGATSTHLVEADALFRALNLGRHVERTRQLAEALGARLA